MSTWYRVDRWRFSLGKITEVEVVKETEKCVFVQKREGRDPNKYAKDSRDYHFFDNSGDAIAKVKEMIQSRNDSLRDEIDRNEDRLEQMMGVYDE